MKGLEFMQHYDENLKLNIIHFVDKYYVKHNESPSLQKIADGVGKPRTTIYRYLLKMNENGELSYSGEYGIQTKFTEKLNTENITVSLVGSIACGTPTYAEENITEYYSLPSSLVGKGDFFLLKASGDSMINAGINDGDLVLIRQQNTAEEGQIVVALVDDETTLKRFYKDKNNKRFRLHPENDEMEDIYVDNLIIQGIAVKVWKDLI